MNDRIQINRAPVLTLWASVAVERMGYLPDEAITLANLKAAWARFG